MARSGAARLTCGIAVWLAMAAGVPAALAQDPAGARASVPSVGSPAYELQPGDVLTVSVWRETDLQSDVLVRPDGRVSFALAGDVAAAGRTVEQLRGDLESRLRRYVPEAVVTVAMKNAGGNRVYVIGKVARSGDFPIVGPLDVMQALSLAGGVTTYADSGDIRILRRTGEQQVTLRFDMGDVEHGRKLEQNILLHAGDTVVVP